jgi:uncharacterized protein YgiM (DUF1202 family)
MSKTLFLGLWVLAGCVFVALLAATLTLAARTRAHAILSRPVYLTSNTLTVHLHQQPRASSPVAAVLVRGSEVVVSEVTRRGGQTWYLVQKGKMTPGWVPSSHIQFRPP